MGVGCEPLHGAIPKIKHNVICKHSGVTLTPPTHFMFASRDFSNSLFFSIVPLSFFSFDLNIFLHVFPLIPALSVGFGIV